MNESSRTLDSFQVIVGGCALGGCTYAFFRWTSPFVDRHEPKLGKCLRYARDSMAIVAPVVVVPTLDSALSRAAIGSRHWKAYDVLTQLMHSDEAVRQGRWWCVGTHWMVHADGSHKWGNLAALAVSGWVCYDQFGFQAYCCTFLSSAAFAAVSKLGTLAQNRPGMVATIPFPDVAGNYVHGCGASAGIAGLSAVAMCVNTERLCARVQEYRAYHSSIADALVALVSDHTQWTVFTVLMLHSDVSAIVANVAGAWSGGCVGHAQHLSGALCGAVAYLLLRRAQRMSFHSSSPDGSSSDGAIHGGSSFPGQGRRLAD